MSIFEGHIWNDTQKQTVNWVAININSTENRGPICFWAEVFSCTGVIRFLETRSCVILGKLAPLLHFSHLCSPSATFLVLYTEWLRGSTVMLPKRALWMCQEPGQHHELLSSQGTCALMTCAQLWVILFSNFHFSSTHSSRDKHNAPHCVSGRLWDGWGQDLWVTELEQCQGLLACHPGNVIK